MKVSFAITGNAPGLCEGWELEFLLFA